MNTLNLDLDFKLNGPTTPTRLNLNLRFRLSGPIASTTKRLDLDFVVMDPDPTVFVFDEEWTPKAQRVWTSQGWFPAL